ncbi:MAG: hypothetical protein MK324_15350 [Pirellulales bacterium]|nr:hypothetical protein [Pirellulales bacterium]
MKNSVTRGNSWLNKQYGRVLRKVRLIDHLKKLGIDPRVLKKSYAEKHRKSPRKWWKSVALDKTIAPRRYRALLEELEPRLLLTANTWEVDLAELDNYQDRAVLELNDTNSGLVLKDANMILASALFSENYARAEFTGSDRSELFVINVNPSELEGYFASGILFLAGDGDDDSVQAMKDNLIWEINGEGTGSVSSLSINAAIGFQGVETIATTAKENTLDYNNYGSAVAVDLSENSATGFSGLVTGFQHVKGSRFSDTIVGDSNDNLILGGDGNDTLTGGPGDDTYLFSNGSGNDTVTENSATDGTEGIDTFDFTTLSENLTVEVTNSGSAVFTHGSGQISVGNVERVKGGSGVNTIDYSAYEAGVVVNLAEERGTLFELLKGFANVIGTDFDDSLYGNNQANLIRGGDGNDTLRGGLGEDTLDGGPGIDLLSERTNADMWLTDDTITIGSDVDQITSVEAARLTGGLNPNIIDAREFTLGGVIIDGGSQIYLSDLKSAIPSPATDKSHNLILGNESTTLVKDLNNEIGATSVAGDDFRITFRDGTSVDINLSIDDATTVEDILGNITAASPRLTATMGSKGTSILISDNSVSTNNTGEFSIRDLGRSKVAEQLGISHTSKNYFILGDPITRADADILISLKDGSKIPVEMSGVKTLKNVFDNVPFASDKVLLTIAPDGQRLIAQDLTTGNHSFQIRSVNESSIASVLGLEKTSDGNTITGDRIVETYQRLDGTADADTITGADQDEFFTGGKRADIIGGLNGETTLVERHDADFILTDSSLSINDSAPYTLSDINKADLRGGDSDNLIDASAFHGTVIIDGRSGNDTLKGGSGNDTITGCPCIDAIAGGGGHDTVLEIGYGRLIATSVSSNPTTATLDMAEGISETVELTIPPASDDGSFLFVYTKPGHDSEKSKSLSFGASQDEILSALKSLSAIGPGNVRVSPAAENNWLI